MDKTLESRFEQARGGNAKAWRELVGEHLGVVYAVCRAFGLDDDAAAEVNQAVWLRLAEHLPRIRTPAAVGGWIAATARRDCLDSARDAGRRGWIVGGLTWRLGEGVSSGQVVDSVALGSSFARLGAFAQRLLRLSSVRPRPPDEVIAAALDLSASVVPVERRRALNRLELLARLGTTASTPLDVEAALARAVTDGDPVPAAWWSAAEAALGWLRIDAELAEIVYDSSFSDERERREHAGGAEGVSSGNGSARRSLRFSNGPRKVDVIIDIANGSSGPAQVSLSGRVDPPKLQGIGVGEGEITVRCPRGALAAAVDPDGAFHLYDLPLGPLSVEVDGGGNGDGDEAAATAGFKTGWIFP